MVSVGAYFDLRNPQRWRREPAELYGSFLDLCEEVERVGLDSIWLTEHHGFDDDYIPSPMTMLAAAAARTSRVRLGTGIVIAPLHAPAELAEQAAVLDLVSGGRFDLGIGAGYRPPEFELYGADIRRRYRDNNARAGQIRELWASGKVTPVPVQPRLPIWMGYLGPKGARQAGLLGEHLLSPDARLWEHYRAGLIEGGHDPAIARMGGGLQAWASSDPERDWPIVSQHLAEQLNSYRLHARMGYDDLPPFKPVDIEAIRNRQPSGYSSLNAFQYGTPDEIVDFAQQYSAGAPVDTLYFWASLPGMSNDQIVDNIRLIANEVAPRLRERLSVPPA